MTGGRKWHGAGNDFVLVPADAGPDTFGTGVRCAAKWAAEREFDLPLETLREEYRVSTPKR